MVIVGIGVIHDLRGNIPCQYLIEGLTIYGELILVTHKHMVLLGSPLYTK